MKLFLSSQTAPFFWNFLFKHFCRYNASFLNQTLLTRPSSLNKLFLPIRLFLLLIPLSLTRNTQLLFLLSVSNPFRSFSSALNVIIKVFLSKSPSLFHQALSLYYNTSFAKTGVPFLGSFWWECYRYISKFKKKVGPEPIVINRVITRISRLISPQLHISMYFRPCEKRVVIATPFF